MEVGQILLLQITFWLSGTVFTRTLEKRNKFWWRFGGYILLVIVHGIVLYCTGRQEIALSIVGKASSFVLIVLALGSCWNIHWTTAIYDTVWGISLWQLIQELWKLIRSLYPQIFIEKTLADILLLLVLYTVSYEICAHTIAIWMPKDRKGKLGPRQLFSAILLFLIIQVLAFSPSLSNYTTYSDDWKFLYLSQLMCVVILYLQNELFKKGEIKQELALMNLLLKKEQEHYELTKENIALINQKSHDLKHQIRALRHAKEVEFDKYLEEMEDSLRIYDAIVKTGNEVLDTILTEKSLYCKDKKIQVSCVANGSQMEFINTIDLYAILGNIMDNAIEAVEKFEEVEKRQIDVMIFRQQNFLVMNVINPMPQKLKYVEELPVTTKGDKNFHGFGLRSVRHLVGKYDGMLHISEEDGCFSIKILMPIPNN